MNVSVEKRTADGRPTTAGIRQEGPQTDDGRRKKTCPWGVLVFVRRGGKYVFVSVTRARVRGDKDCRRLTADGRRQVRGAHPYFADEIYAGFTSNLPY
jgi:hypothetical protein